MKNTLLQDYKELYPHLFSLAGLIESDLREYLKDYKRIDRICARAKGVEKFIAKSEKIDDDGKAKYKNPLTEIQDQIGARVITYYLDDVDKLDTLIHKYYRPIEETQNKPKSVKEFSYEAKHFILLIPDDILCKFKGISNMPKVFELQVKTLFQHAWAEAEHDLNYKAGSEIKSEDKKLLYFSAAQAWGADRAFNEVLKRYN